MKIAENIARWWQNINRRLKISIYNSVNGKEWHTHISPVRGVMVIIAVVILFFMLMLFLVSYTATLEILPAYRTAADRTRDNLIDNIVKIDSMQRVIGDMIIYNENVGLILEGKTPVVKTTIISDSIKYNRTFTPTNAADSALRAQMEGQGVYNLQDALHQERIKNNTINFSAPIDGIITEHFNLREGHFGVRIAATSQTRIVAVEQGVVVHSMWTPENSNIVEILHPDNTITIYKNMSQSLVSKGDRVNQGKIIGYSSRTVDNTSEQLFGFEMWRDGKPTNPERYIIF